MRAAPLILLAALSACAKGPPSAPLAPPGPPPGVEGRYRGTARLVRSDDRACPRSGPRVYEVENGVVTLAYSTAARPGARATRVPLTATIQPDGRIQANDGVGSMEGQLLNGTLEVSITSRECEHRWTMRKVP